MNYRRVMMLAMAAIFTGRCATVREIQEIKYVGFDDNLNRGKRIGSIEGDDCVWKVGGYWLGSAPTVSSALKNARADRKSSVSEVLVASNEKPEQLARYMNNMRVNYSGWDLKILGKSCLTVQGVGYK